MTSVDTDRRHTVHGRERKEQLTATAATLFEERGYSATRISDICAAAGVAKGLFYWYFPTKRDVFAELVRDMRRRLRVAQAAAMDRAADPVTQIRQGTEASIRFTAEHAAFFALVDHERGEADVADVLREGRDIYAADVERLVRAGQHAGLVAAGDARLVAIGVVGAVATFADARRTGRIDADVDELAEFVGCWVQRALSG
jgi:AcrR family transcriptional regulator